MATTSPTTENQSVPTDETYEEDTIFALSSGGGGASIGSGATAVAVIRMSGSCAFDALRELLSPYPLSGEENGDTVKVPKLPKARMASLRTLYDPLSDGDEAQLKRDPLDSALNSPSLVQILLLAKTLSNYTVMDRVP